jgi:signal transduction histidine kinase
LSEPSTSAPLTDQAKAKPRSLRSQLTLTLVPVFGVVLMFAATLFSRQIKEELEQTLDARLRTLSATMESLLAVERSHVELHFSDQMLPQFSAAVTPEYFQIWHSDGRVLERSSSLHKQDLLKENALQTSFQRRLQIANLRLPNGEAGRILLIRFRPQLGDSWGTSAHLRAQNFKDQMGEQTKPLMIIAVACERGAIDRSILWLRIALAVGVAAVMVLLSLLTWWITGRALAPVRDVAAQLPLIGPLAPDRRVESMGIASEFAPVVTHFNAALERMERGLERERLFSRDVAHELRTPIAELRNLAEVAQRFPDAMPADVLRGNVADIASTMEALVSTLLKLARIDGRLETARYERINVAELIRALTDAISPGRICCVVDDNWWITADIELLKILLNNLLKNACEYAPPPTQISLIAAHDNTHGQIVISNQAPLLHAHDMPLLTQRFWRKQREHGSGEHSGLGLALCSSIAQCMNMSFALHFEQGTLSAALSQIPLAAN